jgi:hypothetical protein
MKLGYEVIEVSFEELKALKERAPKGPLGEGDCQKLEAAIQALSRLIEMIGDKDTTISSLRALLAKPSTEKTSKVREQAGLTLEMLHDVLQVTMGWYDSHLHGFRVGQKRFGEPDPEDGLMGLPAVGNERDAFLFMVLGKAPAKAIYTCDFGDSWEHVIVVEKVLPSEQGAAYPICAGGKRQCPPEDCGRVPGYYNLLEAIGNPAQKEHEEMLGWVGGHYDPEAFSVDEVNQSLAPLQRWWAKT